MFYLSLRIEIADNISNSTFKRSTSAISYHRREIEVRRRNSCHCAEHYFIIENLFHRGFIDLKVWSLVSRQVSGQSIVYWSRRFDCFTATQARRLKFSVQQEGVLYKITRKCGKEYIGETGRGELNSMKEIYSLLALRIGRLFRTRRWSRTCSCLGPD